MRPGYPHYVTRDLSSEPTLEATQAVVQNLFFFGKGPGPPISPYSIRICRESELKKKIRDTVPHPNERPQWSPCMDVGHEGPHDCHGRHGKPSLRSQDQSENHKNSLFFGQMNPRVRVEVFLLATPAAPHPSGDHSGPHAWTPVTKNHLTVTGAMANPHCGHRTHLGIMNIRCLLAR